MAVEEAEGSAAVGRVDEDREAAADGEDDDKGIGSQRVNGITKQVRRTSRSQLFENIVAAG